MGVSQHHHAVRVLLRGHPFGPLIFLSVAIAQWLHYASYQKWEALTDFYLLILFQNTDLKQIDLRNVSGEGVQHPGKHHHGLGVSPQLLPDPGRHLKGWIWLSQTHCAPGDRLA